MGKRSNVASYLLTSIVDNGVNPSVDLYGFLHHLAQLFERYDDIPLRGINFLTFQVHSYIQGTDAGNGNDLIAAFKRRKGQVSPKTDLNIRHR
jgi:hypothetical protein